MTQILVRHRVNDYETWKKAFDEFVDIRKAGGEKAFKIWHSDGDANNLYIYFEWDTPENAKAFMNSPKLKEAMQKGGVAEAPDISFVTQVAEGTL